jgi:hypothetical protein
MEVRNPLAEIDSQFDIRLSVFLNNRNTNTDVKLTAQGDDSILIETIGWHYSSLAEPFKDFVLDELRMIFPNATQEEALYV